MDEWSGGRKGEQQEEALMVHHLAEEDAWLEHTHILDLVGDLLDGSRHDGRLRVVKEAGEMRWRD